jgi:hypothetical protein
MNATLETPTRRRARRASTQTTPTAPTAPMANTTQAARTPEQKRAAKAANDKASRAARRAAERTPEEHDANDLAQKLLFLTEQHPRFREELNRLVDKVRTIGKATPDRVKDLVTGAMELGAATLEEMHEDTDLPEKEIKAWLTGAEALGIVRTETRGRAGRAHGAALTIYFLTGKKSISPMVNP